MNLNRIIIKLFGVKVNSKKTPNLLESVNSKLKLEQK